MWQAFMEVFVPGLRVTLGIKKTTDWLDTLQTMKLKHDADPAITALLNDFPDFKLLENGDITSLTVHVVLYDYQTDTIDGEGNPVFKRDFILRYVGGGTSLQSATDLKVSEDPDYFSSSAIKSDIMALTGRDNAIPVKALLAETKWNAHEGFAFKDYEEDVDHVVTEATRKADVISAIDKAPDLQRRVHIVKQAQLEYETALIASLSLKDRIRLQDSISAKNRILADLEAAVADYDAYRQDLARQQSLAVIGYLLSAASLAIDILDRQEQMERWGKLNERFDAIEQKIDTLGNAVSLVESEIKALGKKPSVIYQTNILNTYIIHQNVSAPVPINGPQL